MRLLLEGGKVIEIHGPADITEETTEAIANAANSYLLGGGGVDCAIHEAGGPAILAECRKIVSKIGTLAPGKAVITSAGNLAAKHVIHTVGPVYRGGENGEAEILASAHRESVRLADEHGEWWSFGPLSGPCFQGQKAIVRGVASSRKFLAIVLWCISFHEEVPGHV